MFLGILKRSPICFCIFVKLITAPFFARWVSSKIICNNFLSITVFLHSNFECAFVGDGIQLASIAGACASHAIEVNMFRDEMIICANLVAKIGI
jgi:hypothetical protein